MSGDGESEDIASEIETHEAEAAAPITLERPTTSSPVAANAEFPLNRKALCYPARVSSLLRGLGMPLMYLINGLQLYAGKARQLVEHHSQTTLFYSRRPHAW